jgi:MFS family permease
MPPAPEVDPDEAPVSWKNLAFIAFVANLGSLLFGYDFGATSWLITTFEEYSSIDDDTYTIYEVISNSDALTGLIAAGSAMGAAITFVFLLFFGNEIAKNDEIMLAAFLYFGGALLESTSGNLSWSNYTGLAVLITGRFVYGAGIATSFHSVPQYISELGPREGRGSIGSTTEAMVVAGVVLGFVVGYFNEGGVGWIVTFRVGYLIAVVMGVLAFFIPRSPSWLVRCDAEDHDVLESIQFVRPTATIEAVHKLREISENAKRDRKAWDKKMKRDEILEGSNCCSKIFYSLNSEIKLLLSRPNLRKCLILALTLVVLQQLNGQGPILYYAGMIFDTICGDSSSECIIGFGAIKLVSACSMVFIADWLTRRKFLIGGTAVMVGGLITLCLGLGYGNNTMALVGIYVSVAASEVGLSSLLWVVLNEIFPQFVRSAAISIAVAVFFAWSAVVVFVLPFIADSIGLVYVFVIYAVASAIAVVIMYLFVPETRGIELELAYKQVSKRIAKKCGCCGCKDDEEDAGLDSYLDYVDENPLLKAQTGTADPAGDAYASASKII